MPEGKKRGHSSLFPADYSWRVEPKRIILDIRHLASLIELLNFWKIGFFTRISVKKTTSKALHARAAVYPWTFELLEKWTIKFNKELLVINEKGVHDIKSCTPFCYQEQRLPQLTALSLTTRSPSSGRRT
jgi:hypothetical protein